RYFAWRLEPDGQFRFWIDRAKLRAERRVEGTFLLQTNDQTLAPLQLVAAYKDLQTVAALRPIRLVTLELEGAQARVLTKKLTPYAQAVLKAVGLARLPVPEGP
ncbi:MAG: hypothetical protein K6U74_18100, partial [Firmicutes bacterium]|nr:hypothetical protein [Bacillota bacterium]